MAIGRYCQITGERKRSFEVVAEAHGLTVTSGALMNDAYGDPPAGREAVRAMLKYCAVCGAEQPSPAPERCVSCNAALTAEVMEEDLSRVGRKPSFSRRIAAFLLDAAVILILAGLTAHLIGFQTLIELGGASAEGPAAGGPPDITAYMKVGVFMLLIASIILVAYHTLFTWLAGTSPGKTAMGYRIYLKNGDPRIGFGRALVRSVLYLFTLYVIPIGLLPLLFQKTEGLKMVIIENDAMFHDELTDCRTVSPSVGKDRPQSG